MQISPDGRRLATGEEDLHSTDTNIWIRDLKRETRSRLTFDATASPVWSPNGAQVAYSRRQGSRAGLYSRSASGAGAETLLHSTDVANVRRESTVLAGEWPRAPITWVNNWQAELEAKTER